MTMKINFQLVTPEQVVLKKELTSLTCPTTLGQITILPGHAELVATLVAGELHAKTPENEEFFINVAGGVVQVKKGNEVIVLADAAEHYHEIDVQRAEEAKRRAQEALKQAQLMSDEEYAKVAASLERSLARLRISRKHARRNAPITGEGVFNE